MEEAVTMRPEQKKQPTQATQKEEKKTEFFVPTFTNTKKGGDKPSFTKLEEQKELDHHGELTSSPYKESNPREFKVAGDIKKKERKQYYNDNEYHDWKQKD